jgi:hypothetical protein
MAGPDRQKQRIVSLQRQLRIARDALLRIREYHRFPHSIAGSALYEIENIERASTPDHSEFHKVRFRGTIP